VIAEHVHPEEEYYLLASASAQRRPQFLLNHAESFAIFDLDGDIPLARREAYGLFHYGTRFLSRYELRLNGQLPLLLSTTTTHEGSGVVTYLSNADEVQQGKIVLLRDSVAVRRDKTLFAGTLYERIHLHNFKQESLSLELRFLCGADFADIFELRGSHRAQHGELLGANLQPDRLHFSYRGLDDVWRETVLSFSPTPSSLLPDSVNFALTLGPGEETALAICVSCHVGHASPRPIYTLSSALDTILTEREAWCARFPQVSTNHEGFNAWVNRSLHDLALLHVDTGQGAYVSAGIPWFATLFGRDSLITALETVAFSPDLAAGVLRTLARLQGQDYRSEREEEPGKILHEMRHGEMAATGEIPFGRYYGSIDATPLFLLLLAEYADRTGDLALIQELWPAALAAVRWMERASDSKGYLTYAPRSTRGLINQGWKDSHDAIMHADGTLAEPPIALAEVQAYMYAARRRLAPLARQLGDERLAETWDTQATRLQEQFQHDFWLPEEHTFALALDAHAHPCRVVSSNAGHCLYGQIASSAQARQLIDRFFQDDMFCGWGIRTLSAQSRRYNPMSYHNGSVWPHDNAIIAAGFARYGANDQAERILSALFDASTRVVDHRLPELFCGFPRQAHQGPVPYPVACKPQAWAAGSLFQFLQAILGLRIDAWAHRMTLGRVVLPVWLNEISIRGLQVHDARVDLRIVRGRASAAVEVLEKHGDVEIVVHE
jgi:glycogen debranching enzyme